MERSGIFKGKSFMDKRSAFISYLDHHGLKGSQRNRLVVIFDGKEDVFAPRMDCSFEVIFTKGGSADDRIKEMVADSWLSQRIRNGLETMLSYPRTHRTLESVCQTVQHWKMKHHPCARSRKPNASIIVSPTVLKFHEDDRRHELRQKFSLHLRRYRCVS